MTLPLLFDFAGKRVYVAGHNGMVGSAILRRLAGESCEVLTATRQSLDLTQQSATEDWLLRNKPDAVIITRWPRRRHFREQHLSGGLYNRQPCDRPQRHSRLL